jgi:cystathionine gamma-synthase/cystathionine gamma-lyase/cystathionine beta-lyase
MLSFRPVGGQSGVDRILNLLKIGYPAPSLGGVETLVTVPAQTSHAGMTREQRQAAGIADDLIRVSCGIESASDLIDDFARALALASEEDASESSAEALRSA